MYPGKLFDRRLSYDALRARAGVAYSFKMAEHGLKPLWAFGVPEPDAMLDHPPVGE
jgi:hypothetical protein